jgi:hypothetical protein
MQATSTNTLFELAESFVNHTSCNLFLTGKAGTGKTTFLRHIKENTPKSCVVVAPTGVAAINAGGVTMHSFFQLPFVPYIPEGGTMANGSEVHNQRSLFRNIRFAESKRRMMQHMQLLIIDEVSMLRADMLDAMDAILRRFRKKPHLPFGGLQVLFIGDLLQLPPVVQDHEWEVLQKHYPSPFFFDAKVLREHPPLCIELKHIYRQQDDVFIGLLNKVRNNAVSPQDIELLNARYNPAFVPTDGEFYITLSTHNHKANTINQRELDKLGGQVFAYNAIIKGTFQEGAYPAEERLMLKEGAQVMFIRNDAGEERKYYNGKLGTISRLEKEGIWVQCPGEEEEIKVEPIEWENVKYKLDEEKGEIKEEKLGSFVQYPLRLAWAITIHKSQGLTFDRAIIDAGSSFSAGQVYVALSRLTNMNGMVLHSRIAESSISTDAHVLRFMAQEQDEERMRCLLKEEQQKYLQQTLTECFDWSTLHNRMIQHLQLVKDKELPDDSGIKLAQQLVGTVLDQQTVAEKFVHQIKSLLSHGSAAYPRLQERVHAAVPYFEKDIQEKLLNPLDAHIRLADKWKRAKGYVQELEALEGLIQIKLEEIGRATILTDGLLSGMDEAAILAKWGQEIKQHASQKQTDSTKAAKTNKAKVLKEKKDKKERPSSTSQTYQITLEMFKSGKDIGEIATMRELAISTIESHLARFVASGELSMEELVDQEKAKNIEVVITAVGDSGLSAIKEKLGDEYSYGEIKIVLADRKRRGEHD